MIGIIDYGAGNLFSVKNALNFLGVESEIATKPEELENFDKLILPGVGAYPDAMNKLSNAGFVSAIKDFNKPLLGICLGMQLLFEYSEEFERVEGLGLIGGYVDKLIAPRLKVPHMGWNDVKVENECALSKGAGDRYYFVHSYKAVTSDENISLYAVHGQKIPALVFNKKVFGTQFHPEKSGDVGLRLLENFARL